MIRSPKNYVELVGVIDLMEAAFARSKWALTSGAAVDRHEARRRLTNAKDRSELRRAGGTYFQVAESAGRLTGFMVGEIDRIYGVGTLLQASDVYLYAQTEGADPMDWMRMVKGYVEWAQGIGVAQIVLSHTDFIEGEHRDAVQRYYQHLGFSPMGSIFEQRAA